LVLNKIQVVRRLSLATLVPFSQQTGVPGLIFGVVRAKPSSANLAMNCRGRAAWFIHRGNGLTGPFEVRPGFCMILLLQHKPLHAVNLTRVWQTPNRRAVAGER